MTDADIFFAVQVDKKKKPEWKVEKGGAALLERPDDVDGGKAEEWLVMSPPI